MERHAQTSSEERVVRIALPVDLIVRMDRLLSRGAGGFTTRQELIREALENQVLELSHQEAPPEPAVAHLHATDYYPVVDGGEPDPESPSRLENVVRLEDVGSTAIPTIEPGWTMAAGSLEVPDEPLLGLHNRDYPSLWALRRLGDHCHAGSVRWDALLDTVTQEAWAFGASLRDLERRDDRRGLTALFPVNYEKAAAAERGFRSFAVGGTPRHPIPGEPVTASGPLPTWKVIDLAWDGPALLAGVTQEGWSMLKAIAGISLNLPHDESVARSFLAHLRAHAPADYSAFTHTVQAVSDGPDRPYLLQTFAERFGGTDAVAGSLAQGYIARAREWGLVEPKLVDGRYWLTAFGRTALEEITAA